MNKISFDGLGMDINKTDIGNYRIISNFQNNKQYQCFVEISHFEENNVLYGTIRQAYIIKPNITKHCFKSFDEMYNVKFLLTKEGVLKIVNQIFETEFDEIEIILRKDERWKGILRTA